MVKLHDWTKSGGQSWSSMPRGLDLEQPDVTTLQEWEAWRESDRIYRGFPLPTYDLLGVLGRPDVVKRWFLQIPTFYAEKDGFFSAATFLHLYALQGFEEGVIYEIDNCQSQGLEKQQVVEVLALAFLHSPSNGFFSMKETIEKRLREYSEPERPVEWPEGWAPDPEFFEAGLDFSKPELSPEEREKLEAWYQRVCGEVPRHVGFLAEFRPQMLKAYRNRFENTVRCLPKQMFPWTLLQFEALRGYPDSIRDTVLLARGFGLTKTQTVDGLIWAFLYGGHGAMSLIDRAVGDLLREPWD